MTLTSPELDRLFTDLKKKHFVVLGDFCLDAYYFLDSTGAEVSVETGLKTRAVKTTRITPGGAGNLAANLAAMGASNVHGLGVVGDDLFGRGYLDLLLGVGVSTDGMVVQSANWETCVYTKLYENDAEKPRIDIGNYNRLDAASAEALLHHLQRLLPRADVVLINQQLRNGIHTNIFRDKLQKVIRDHADKIFVLDSRDFIDEYPGTIRKLNDREAARSAGIDCDEQDWRHIDNLRRIAADLYRRWRTRVFITRGQRGSLVHDDESTRVIPGFHLMSKTDTVGAGDSLFAGLAAGLAAGFSSEKAMFFANCVAAVTVQKRFQTGTAGEKEIRAIATSPAFIHHPETAESLRAATYWQDSEIEVLEETESGRIGYAVFDHDGTISTIRQGWEAVMAPMMIKAVLGGAYATASPGVLARITDEVRDYIDQTTGMQTISQMAGLVEMVADGGFIPKDDILEAWDYKQLYLDELNLVVRSRIEKLRRNELDIADFTIKGAVAFLEKISARGVRLFLASGTDQADVQVEAAVLGYADLFDGGIFGASSSITHDPKRAVLGQILSRIGRENGRRIVTFGDGPVEMRKTRKAGGRCVGVASDEIRRFGLNPRKRKRLILAGAEMIIPDFSQHHRLDTLLFEQ